jgi:integrase
MKMPVFVSDPMPLANPSQSATEMNGALDMALQKAAPFALASRAAATLALYDAAFARWTCWCTLHHTRALPAEPRVVAAYLAALARAGKSVAAINGALAAIQFKNRAAGFALDRRAPLLATVLAGIARTCAKPIRRAAALDISALAQLSDSLAGEDLCSLRDRALILVAFFAALRRSEITSLDVSGRSPIALDARGLTLNLTATKTAAATTSVAVPRRGDGLCPVAALERYLAAANLTSGPLFRAISKSGRLLPRRLDATSVRHILRRRLAAAGLSATTFSPHSLRAGFITAAAHANVPEHLIQRTSRHKSVDVLRSYIRVADAFAENASHYL